MSTPKVYDAVSTSAIPLDDLSESDCDETIDLTVQESPHLCRQFGWINVFVLFCPMWCSRTPELGLRYCNRWWLTFILIALTFHLAIVCHWILYVHHKDMLSQAMYMIFEVCFITPSRLVSIYYFYTKCTYPWMHNFRIFSITSYTPKVTKLIKTMFCCLLFVDCSQLIVYILKNVPVQNPWHWKLCYYLMLGLGRVFLYWPNIITFVVAVIIIKKHHLYLVQLKEFIKSHRDLCFGQILVRYTAIHESFQREYNGELKWFAQLLISAYILRLWTVSYELMHFGNRRSILNVLMLSMYILLYFLIASEMNETYEKFLDVLWARSSQYVLNVNEKERDKDNDLHVNYLALFVQRHRMELKMGDIVMTKQNAIISIMAFLVVRVVAYLFAQV